MSVPKGAEVQRRADLPISDEIRGPVRPSIPVLAWVAACVWLGVAGSEHAAWMTAAREPITAVVAVPIVCCVAAFLAYRSRARFAALLLIALVAGMVAGGASWARWARDVDAFGVRAVREFRVEVVGDPVVGDFGSSSDAHVLEPPRLRGSRVRMRWRDDVVPEAGETLLVLGKAVAPRAKPESLRRDLRDRSIGSISVLSVRERGRARSLRGFFLPVRTRARARVDRIAGEGSALLSGILVGDRRRLAGTPTETAFKTTGLTHLIAVSGSHLVVVAALAAAVAGLVGLGLGGRATLVLAVTVAYVVFSGVQVSAVRALVMSVIGFVRPASGRRGDSAAALSLTVAVMLLLDPSTAFDLGFRLSVAAVAGLVWFGRLFETWVGAVLPRHAKVIAGPVALTLAAQATTGPLLISTFGMVSLVSPAANVVIGPLVSVALVVGVAGLLASTLWDALGRVVLSGAAAVCGIASSLAGWLASLPRAAVISDGWVRLAVLTGALSLPVLWIAWPQPRPGGRVRVPALVAVTAGLIIAVGGPSGRNPTLAILDVGQGDAILVRDRTHAVLVDTGPSESALRRALSRVGIRTLDAVVITHPHDDHSGGMSGLEGVVSVGAVYQTSASVPGQAIPGGAPGGRRLEASDALRVGRWTLDVLWPDDSARVWETNDTSVVLLARCGEFEALLTGDAEGGVLQQLVENADVGDIDVLKVAHHGSRGAQSATELAVLRPEYALISVGTGNSFGHPARSTLDELGAAGSVVLRTDLSGDLTVEVTDGRYEVRAQRVRSSACETIGGRGLPGPTLNMRWCADAPGPRRPQTRLPDLRLARAEVGAGPRPPQAALLSRGRPGFQLADVSRRGCGRGGYHRGLQHDAVHVRAPPCDRARSRQDAKGRPRPSCGVCQGAV